jgi:hypothetical protein
MKKILISGIVAGITLLVLGIVVGTLFNLIFPSLVTEYMNPDLFRPWEDPLMMLFFLHPFILGLILSYVWDKSKSLLKSKDILGRAIPFGLTIWLITSIPGMFITYSSFLVSLPMVISWTINGLIYSIAAGIIFAKMNK